MPASALSADADRRIESCDGRWALVAAADASPLQLFDANGNLVRNYPTTPLGSPTAARVATIHAVAARKSFVVSFKDMTQLWEISWDPDAPAIFDGLVHDFRMAEAIAQPGFLGVRRTVLDEPVDVIGMDARAQVLARTAAALQVINLDVRRPVAAVDPRVDAGMVCSAIAVH
jgi:hypothetical protein